MRKENELDVLKEIQQETKRFTLKLNKLIEELKENKSNSYYYTKNRNAIKRAALDLRRELTRITTSTGAAGTLYYKD